MSAHPRSDPAEIAQLWSDVAGDITCDLQHLGREAECAMQIVADASCDLRDVFSKMYDMIVPAGSSQRPSDEFTELAGEAVRLLQFEDASRQLAEHVRNRANFLRVVIDALAKVSPNEPPCDIVANLTQVRALVERDRDLFRDPHHLARTESIEASDSTDDDIVLF